MLTLIFSLTLIRCAFGTNIETKEKGFVGWYESDKGELTRVFFSSEEFGYCDYRKVKK